MKLRKFSVVLALIFIISTFNISSYAYTDETQQSVDSADTLRSINIEDYNKSETTVTCVESTNSPDMSSIKITANSGEYLVFDDVYFTGAKRMIFEAAIDSGSEAKNIELYIDDATDPNNMVGTLVTRDAKVGELDFNDSYAELSQSVIGSHKLIFKFNDSGSMDADWFKLTAYTGSETQSEYENRMKWWKDAAYGQFIHFGAYSYLGGEYNGQTARYPEWIMSTLKIDKEEYKQNVAANFNPTDFDAAKIVSDAKASGCKYLVITTRHHEGFSMYDTKIRTYKDYGLFSVANDGNYNGVDVVAKLSEECKKQGLVFGTYVSIVDWHDPSQTDYGNKIADGYTKEEYVSQLKGQIKELIEKYGSQIIWFDGQWKTWWKKEDGQDLHKYILSLNENCITNCRIGKEGIDDGDYDTPEGQIPVTAPRQYWETCTSMNGKWGYAKDNTNWKTPETIVKNLLEIVGKGGNLLLNVGPDGKGVVPEDCIANMKEAGPWLNANEEAWVGKDKNCFTRTLPANVYVTTKQSDDKSEIYVTSFGSPKARGTIKLPALNNNIVSIKELRNSNDVSYNTVGDDLIINIDSAEDCGMATTFVITVDGIPEEKEIPPVDESNMALNCEVSGSSQTSSTYAAEKAVDGDKNTYWLPKDKNNPAELVIDLGESKDISNVYLYEKKQDGVYTSKGLKVCLSQDGTNYDEVYKDDEAEIDSKYIAHFDSTNARYVKIILTDIRDGKKGYAAISEVEVYGELVSAVSIIDKPEKIWKFPYTLSGTYKDYGDVTVRVFGSMFEAYTIDAVEDKTRGTWSAVIPENNDALEGEMSFVVYLRDSEGNLIASDEASFSYKDKVNLAYGKSASASDNDWSYEPSKLVDGFINNTLSTGKTSKWTTHKETADRWATIDFGENVDLSSVVLYEYNNYIGSFKLSVSIDGKNWTEIHSGTTMRMAYTVNLENPVMTRYLKIHDIEHTPTAKYDAGILEIEAFSPDYGIDLMVNNDGSGTTLTWNDTKAASTVKYQIWCNDNLINTVDKSVNEYLIEPGIGLSSYRIKAVDSNEKVVCMSKLAADWCGARLSLKSSYLNGKNVLSWDAFDSSKICGLYMYRDGKRIADLNTYDTSFTDSGNLIDSTTESNTYSLKAVDGIGNIITLSDDKIVYPYENNLVRKETFDSTKLSVILADEASEQAVKVTEPSLNGDYSFGIENMQSGVHKFTTGNSVYCDITPYLYDGYLQFDMYVKPGAGGSIDGTYKIALDSSWGVSSDSYITLDGIHEGWNKVKFKLSDLYLSRLQTSNGNEVYRCSRTCGLNLSYNGTSAPTIYIQDISFWMNAQATTVEIEPDESGNVNLKWTCLDSSAVKYDVYRNGKLIADNITENLYIDTAPNADAVNSYKVVSKDSDENELSASNEHYQIIYDSSYKKDIQIYTNKTEFKAQVNMGTGNAVKATSPIAGGKTVCGTENVSNKGRYVFADTTVSYDLTDYINEGYVKIPMYVKPGTSGKIDGTYKICLQSTGGVTGDFYTLSNIHEGWNFISIKLSDLKCENTFSSGAYKYTKTVGINITYIGEEAPSIYVQDIAVWTSVRTEIKSVDENNGKVTLSWDTVADDAVKYDVYRNGTVIVSDITDKTYTDNNPDINVLNKYKVASKNENGDLLSISDEKGRAVYDDKYIKLYSVYENSDRSDVHICKQLDNTTVTTGMSKVSSTSIIPGTSILLNGAYNGDKGLYRLYTDTLTKDMTDFYKDGYLRFLIKVSPYDEENIGILKMYLQSPKGNSTNGYTVPISEYNTWIPVEIKLSDMAPTSATEDRIKIVNGISIMFTGDQPNADIYIQDIGFWATNTPRVNINKTDNGADISWVSYNRDITEYKIYKNGSVLLSTTAASFDAENVFAPYKGTYSDTSVMSDYAGIYSVSSADSDGEIISRSNDVFYNNTASAVTPVYTAATYNGNKLVDIKFIDGITVDPYGIHEFETGDLSTSADVQNSSVKIIVFDKITNMKPLLRSVSANTNY